VQIAVDSKHHLVDVVSDPGDKQQLSHMAAMSQEELSADKLIVVADAGCFLNLPFA